MKRITLALTLALFAGLFFAQLAWADHIVGTADSVRLAENPELSAANRYHLGMTMAKAEPTRRAAIVATEAGRLRGVEAAAARYAALGEAYRTGKVAYLAPVR